MEAKIYKSTGSWYTARTKSGDFYQCRLKGQLRTKGIKNTNPVAVGDEVILEPQANEPDKAVITDIKQRRNYIIRRSSNLSKQYHIIASNIDQALLVLSYKDPEIRPEFADRFLITCEAYNIPAVLVFNKMDILNDDEKEEIQYFGDIYKSIGYQVMFTSIKDKPGLDQIKDILCNKQTLVSGNSGVGKSSIINTIEPHLSLKTAEISESYKTGKHTTTFAEMFPLSFGGYIIDTPGIKSFGVIDFSKDEVYHFFPEIFETSKNCRYNNCLHIDEPGCAVKDALDNGNISALRYRSYCNILFDEQTKYRS